MTTRLRELTRVDARLSRLKRETWKAKTYLLVDEFFEPDGTVQPIYGTPDGLEAGARDQRVLGYAFNPDSAPYGLGGYGRFLPSLSSRQDQQVTITETVGSTTHTIKLNLAAGGHIDSWNFDDGTIDEELINRNNSWVRGVQANVDWMDYPCGHPTRHLVKQGGDRFSKKSFSLADSLGHGGLYLGHTSTADPLGGRKVTVDAVPLCYDPDGSESAAFIDTFHHGSVDNPVLFKGVWFRVELWINYKGTLNVHRLKTTWNTPFGVDSGVVDMSFFHSLHLREDLFGQVRAWDKSGGETTLNNGTIGAGFQAHNRPYFMNTLGYYGNEEASKTGGSPAATAVGSGNGGIAATGATDGDMAVFIGNTLSAGTFGQTSLDMDSFPNGNGFVWLQKRDGTGGIDGDNAVMLAHGAFLQGRFYSETSQYAFTAGEHTMESFIITDTWGNVKTKADALL